MHSWVGISEHDPPQRGIVRQEQRGEVFGAEGLEGEEGGAGGEGEVEGGCLGEEGGVRG